MAAGLNPRGTYSSVHSVNPFVEIDASAALDHVKIAFVVARTRNGVIGCAGRMPWRLKTDMRHFRSVTMGKPIVMGRKTWESLRGPLVGRDNIVLSRSIHNRPTDAWLYSDLEQAIATAKSRAVLRSVDEICIIGGGDVFEQLMGRVDRIYLTEIDAVIEEGDTFFPVFDSSLFDVDDVESHGIGPDDEYATVFKRLDRKA